MVWVVSREAGHVHILISAKPWEGPYSGDRGGGPQPLLTLGLLLSHFVDGVTERLRPQVVSPAKAVPNLPYFLHIPHSSPCPACLWSGL